jgi:hypothetical protein
MKNLRSPEGHFMSREAALGRWLPMLLSWAGWNAVEEALVLLIRHCEREASDKLKVAATDLLNPGIQRVDAPNLEWWGVRKAEQWGRKRAVLVEALAKWRATQ